MSRRLLQAGVFGTVMLAGMVAAQLGGGIPAAPLGQGLIETRDYFCRTGVEFQDFASKFQNVSRDECARLCHAMPDCVVWSQRPQAQTKLGLLRGRRSADDRAPGECLVHYSNTTALANPHIESCHQVTHQEVNMANFIGVAHWQGCYYRSNRPFLLDGAHEIQHLGAETIKVSLNSRPPWDNYPWHSNWARDEWKVDVPSPVEVAKHPYFDELFNMEFNTIVVVAYSHVANAEFDHDTKWTQALYWMNGDPSREMWEKETKDMYDLALFLGSTYANKTFIIQMWEGDWTLRTDHEASEQYDALSPIDPANNRRMIQWLKARQKGVTLAQQELGSNAKSIVWHAAEVNLARLTSLDLEKKGTTDRVDMVTEVLPHVALDLVSYSCYDAALAKDAADGALWRAINLIKSKHVRTPASPKRAMYLGEFGVPSMDTDWDTSMRRVKNALNVAIATEMRHMVYWQVFDNVLNPLGQDKYKTSACDSHMTAHGPVKDQAYVEGYFLVPPTLDYGMPNMQYLHEKLRQARDAAGRAEAKANAADSQTTKH